MTGRYHAIIGACAAILATTAAGPQNVQAQIAGIAAAGAVGGLLPDLDDANSLLGRLVPFGACESENGGRCGRRFFGYTIWHRDQFHSIGMGVFFALPTVILWGLLPAIALLAGFLSHLLCDSVTLSPMMLLWPFNNQRYRLPIPHIRERALGFPLIEMATTALAVYFAWAALGGRSGFVP